MSKNSKKCFRRDFLKNSSKWAVSGSIGSLAVDPIAMIGQALINKSLTQNAQASTSDARRYVYIQQAGANLRVTGDLLLNPWNQQNFVASPLLATKYTESAGRYTGAAYTLDEINGIWVPPVWNFTLPGSGGATSMASLLPDFLQLRGVSTNSSHEIARQLQMQPLGARRSTTSLSADYSNAPIPAVNLNVANYIFLSGKEKTAVRITNGNIISKLMTPFTNNGSTGFNTKLASLGQEVFGARDAIDRQTANAYPEAGGVLSSQTGALDIISRTFPNFGSEWTRLQSKYRGLVNQALRATYNGLNDKPIGTTGTRDETYMFRNNMALDADLGELISQGQPTMNTTADYFAATEFIITHDLSRSISLRAPGIGNLKGNQAQNFDEHNTGSMVSILLNTLYFAGLYTCVLELISVLKSLQVYQDTVIQIAGEFNRKPRTDGSGSDHAGGAQSVVFLSGSIKNGPYVLGNIVDDTGSANYPGTYGQRSRNPGIGNAFITNGHYAATLATMLRAPSPVTAASSLVEESVQGEIKPIAQMPPGQIINSSS